MAKRITDNFLEVMFKAWCDDPCVQYVVKVCAVSRGAVSKYRVKDNWDARLKVIREKARTTLDNDEAKHTAETLKVIKSVRNVYVTSLVGTTKCPSCKAKVPVPKLKPVFGDIDKIIRLEEFIRGKPDARPDVGRTLDLLSDEDLQALWERSNVDVVEGLQRIRAMVGKEKPAAIKKAISALIERLEE